MAKIRHRTFEMFDFLQEATDALASKSARLSTNVSDPESWRFRQLIAARRSSGIVHITFKQRAPVADSVNDLGMDLTDLAGLLINGSRVLLDFEGVLEFGTDSIIELREFNSKLHTKVVELCCAISNRRFESRFSHNAARTRVLRHGQV